MPSKPKPKRKHAHLHRWARIDRAAAAQDVRIHLGAACDLLEVDADFGLHLLQQGYTLRQETRPSLTSYVALLVVHRAILLLDGISVLVKAGCVAPATPLFRTMLEAVMYSRYLMVVNDERIAAAHVVSQPLAMQARTEEEAAQHAPGSRPTIFGRERRQELESIWADDRLFREAKRELETLNAESSVPAPWYQAFGGPRTLGGLSRRLNDEWLQRMFDAYYDRASAAAHVADTADALAISAEDPGSAAEWLTPLRVPRRKDLVHLVRASHDLFLRILLHHMEYYREHPAGLAEYREIERRLGTILDD
jgi:hypothetical protein